jgi:hypothetical protein
MLKWPGTQSVCRAINSSGSRCGSGNICHLCAPLCSYFFSQMAVETFDLRVILAHSNVSPEIWRGNKYFERNFVKLFWSGT